MTIEALVLKAICDDYKEETGEDMDEHMPHAVKMARAIVASIQTKYYIIPLAAKEARQ